MPSTAKSPPLEDDSTPRNSFYVVRWEYQRPPGVLASGIATVPKEAVGGFDQAVFYHLHFDKDGVPFNEEGMADVADFVLASKSPAEQQNIIDMLKKNAQYLIFKSGELAEVDGRDKQPLLHMMQSTAPMFDEHAILKRIAGTPQSVDRLYTSNSFGTWADMVQSKMTGRVGARLVWKKVGNDPALMPTSDKPLVFLQRSKDIPEALG